MVLWAIRGHHYVPDDWSVRVDGPISEETSLHMQAEHGASMLWRLSDLNGFITVIACESSGCFDIAGSVGLYYFDGEEHERKVNFPQPGLILEPAADRASQRRGDLIG